MGHGRTGLFLTAISACDNGPFYYSYVWAGLFIIVMSDIFKYKKL